MTSMNSSTGMPLSTRMSLKTSSDICGRAVCAAWPWAYTQPARPTTRNPTVPATPPFHLKFILTLGRASRVFGPPSSIESVWSHDLHSIGDDFPSLVLHIDPVIICSYAIGSQGVNPALLNDVASTWSCGCESVRDWFPRQGNDHLYPNSRSKILIDVTPEPLYRMRQNEDATSPSSTSRRFRQPPRKIKYWIATGLEQMRAALGLRNSGTARSKRMYWPGHPCDDEREGRSHRRDHDGFRTAEIYWQIGVGQAVDTPCAIGAARRRRGTGSVACRFVAAAGLQRVRFCDLRRAPGRPPRRSTPPGPGRIHFSRVGDSS